MSRAFGSVAEVTSQRSERYLYIHPERQMSSALREDDANATIRNVLCEKALHCTAAMKDEVSNNLTGKESRCKRYFEKFQTL